MRLGELVIDGARIAKARRATGAAAMARIECLADLER
jgi:hypothetical protein